MTAPFSLGKALVQVTKLGECNCGLKEAKAVCWFWILIWLCFSSGTSKSYAAYVELVMKNDEQYDSIRPRALESEVLLYFYVTISDSSCPSVLKSAHHSGERGRGTSLDDTNFVRLFHSGQSMCHDHHGHVMMHHQVVDSHPGLRKHDETRVL